MNFLKKGPEIKLSEIKVPSFVQDVYYDLKDRHLLPVAAILLIALIAVPIAVSGNSSSEEPSTGGPEARASQLGDAQVTGALVAKAAPGLREYERRLNQEQPTDPFYNQAAIAGEKGNGTSASKAAGGESGGSSTSTESYEYPESGPYPSESGGGDTTTKSRLTYYSMAIDVRITGGSGPDKKTTVRKNLPELTMLPSRETPALVYMSATKDEKKVLMTVSSDVQAIYGDAKCALGSETCQLLVMEVGLPVTLVYGGSGKVYTVELLKVDLVESDKLNKAPLGDGDRKKDKTKNHSLSTDSTAAGVEIR